MEFVIDQTKATWYEPWLRTRRLNHAKRAESRARAEADVPDFLRKNEDHLQLEDEDDASGKTREEGYSQLDGDEDDDELDDEITAQLPPVPGAKDPLAGIFGTDADTWAEIHADNRPVLKPNLDVVGHALDGVTLSEVPEEDDTPLHRVRRVVSAGAVHPDHLIQITGTAIMLSHSNVSSTTTVTHSTFGADKLAQPPPGQPSSGIPVTPAVL
jgi:hypothetical protein